MLVAQDAQGLVFWPEQLVASLTPTFPQRWRAVFCDGTVAYLPGPLPAGPWQKLQDSWVNPRHLRRLGDHYQDPAGFLFAWAELADSQPEGSATHPNLPCPNDQIWAVEDNTWHTDSGPIEWPEEAVACHPDLIRVRRDLCFNRRRLRRIEVEPRHFRLVYDNAQAHPVIRRFESKLAAALGLSNLSRLEPYTPALYRRYLREFPFELATAPAAVLRQHFANSDKLIVNLIFQALLYHRAGIDKYYGKDYRGFFYAPVSAALERAGFMRRRPGRSILSDPLWRRFQALLLQLVLDDRLFTFEELGFEDQSEDLRVIGSRLPGVILMAEKGSVARTARQLAERHGLSLMITGGMPHLMASEFFVKALREGYAGPVVVIAYVDFDPAGYIMGEAILDQLARYGVDSSHPTLYLCRPEAFSDEDLELFSFPVPDKGWVEKSGGIHGQSRGIYCNWLRPAERVEEELVKALAALPGREK